VRHGTGDYPVHLGAGRTADLPAMLAALFPGHRPVIISDATVSAHWPDLLAGVERITFPAGEQHKSRTTWTSVSDSLLALGIDRRTVILALGGGVTTDLAGFVAATTLRGLPWMAIPTTTVAMLDASIGGKTGVDTIHGKNLVGAFHHPSAVIIDPTLLDTLPQHVFVDGLAEAVKHAAIASASHWEWLERHAGAILAHDPVRLTELVRESVSIKAEVVADDEREHGRRSVLNAGHTVAHGLELATDYEITHGAAVAIGLVSETRHGEATGITETGTTARIIKLLASLGLPTEFPGQLDRQRFHDALQHDKKNRDGRVHCSLIARIGEVARSPDGGWTHAVEASRLL
jgi:3-dehydroquinate synthase